MCISVRLASESWIYKEQLNGCSDPRGQEIQLLTVPADELANETFAFVVHKRIVFTDSNY